MKGQTSMKNRNVLITTILLTLASLVLSHPNAFGVVPPPDGGYPGGNTAEGQAALLSLTTGTHNPAVGWSSLRSDATGNFNTGVGAGTLATTMRTQIRQPVLQRLSSTPPAHKIRPMEL